MSRIGKQPVAIPAEVTVKVEDGNVVVKGKNGELNMKLHQDTTIEVNGGEAFVKPVNESTRARAMWGTMRNQLDNMIIGVSEGYKKEIEIRGVGYRAAADKEFLTLSLGYSHEIKYALPEGITAKVNKTFITIEGFKKQLVGQVAAEIRELRKPEPYKGKGVRYVGEYVRQKEGKKK